jgi:putative OPT family oligopeptide transporter
LKYPEGVATAAVLQAGEDARKSDTKDESGGLMTIAISGLVGGGMKLCQQGFSMWNSAIGGATVVGGSIFGMGMDLSPALISVGYIVGRNIGILVVAGGVISWAVAIPIFSLIYPDALVPNPNFKIGMDEIYKFISFSELSPYQAAEGIWTSQIRYLGVGAMVVGGIWSLIKLLKPLVDGIKASLEALKKAKQGRKVPREEQDFPINYVGMALAVLLIPVYLLYFDIVHDVGIAILLAVVMMVFGFLFSAVAAYMAGMVGSSNNPISGVTIATILFASLLLLSLLGENSDVGAPAAIMIGAVVCCAAAIGGDNLQDLKTGHIVGATPWKQQVMQIIGVLSASVVLGLVLDILHTAYTIGSPTLSAPQATLMKSVADGVFTGNLPWNMVGFGAIIGILIILIDLRQERIGSDFRVPILAVAVGIYLPIELTVPIFLGGMITHFSEKSGASDMMKKKGLLMASGLITGEALVGILVAVPIFVTGSKEWWPQFPGFQFVGVLVFMAVIAWLYRSVTQK